MTAPSLPSPRQLAALELIAAGLTVGQIARLLKTTAYAISRDHTRLRTKLGALSTPHAVSIGHELGYLKPGVKLWTAHLEWPIPRRDGRTARPSEDVLS